MPKLYHGGFVGRQLEVCASGFYHHNSFPKRRRESAQICNHAGAKEDVAGELDVEIAKHFGGGRPPRLLSTKARHELVGSVDLHGAKVGLVLHLLLRISSRIELLV